MTGIVFGDGTGSATGRGLMPEYGSRITHFDRWRVVNYVRQLQAQAGNQPQVGN